LLIFGSDLFFAEDLETGVVLEMPRQNRLSAEFTKVRSSPE
jgi:hypothetical protein